ncbi:MAG: peptidoglycan DD-metalloendopeptidase family protein [Pseudomonadales bacterium]
MRGLMLLVALCATLPLLLHAPVLLAGDTELEARQQELRELQAAVDALQQQLADKRGKHSAAMKKFQRAEQAINQLGLRAHELRQQRREFERQLHTLEDELAQTTAQQEGQRERVAQYLRAAYIAGSGDALALLMSDASPADLARQLEYLQRVNHARSELIETYSALLRRKAELRDAITAQREANRRNSEQLTAQQAKLAEKQRERSELLDRLEREIGDGDTALARLQDTRGELQALFDTMKKALANKSPESVVAQQKTVLLPGSFTAARGKLPWPVDGQQLARFGRLDPLSGVKTQGIRIGTDSGETVRAIHPGEVIFADWFGGQGLLAILDHGDGYWSLYGHNQSLLKPVGARVSAGEAIATVGNSGGRRQPALYFEIRHNGVPSDPAQWCR